MGDTDNRDAYMIVTLNVKDFGQYMERYVTPLMGQFEKYGIEVVSATAQPEVLEGEWPANWTVILKFPSLAVAREWYQSDEYAPLKALRINELTNGGSAVLVEAFDPSSLGV